MRATKCAAGSQSVLCCDVLAAQVLLAPPAPGAPGNSLDTEPYAAAQRWLDGFMASTVNAPLAASVDNNSNGSSHADAARTVGVSWQVPKPKPPAGEPLCSAGCDLTGRQLVWLIALA